MLEELISIPVDKKLRRYKSNWLRYVTRMNKKTPKIMLNYRPTGRRRLGRPLRRLLDEAAAGLLRSNSWRMMIMMMMMINNTYNNIHDKTYPPGSRLFESRFFIFWNCWGALKHCDVDLSHFRNSSCAIARSNKHKPVFTRQSQWSP